MQYLNTPLGQEISTWLMNILSISQGMNDPYSHAGSEAIDLSGGTTAKDAVYAPFDVKCVYKANDATHTILFQSVNKVWTPKGLQYVRILMKHCADITPWVVGTIYKRSTIIGYEGGQGPNGPTTYPSHVHLNVGFGVYTGGDPMYKNPQGVYELKNGAAPYDVFFINGAIVKNGLNYPWLTYADPIPAPMKDVQNMAYKTGVDKVNIRSKPSTSYPIIGVMPATTQVNISQVSTAQCDGYDWVKLNYNGVDGYCAVVPGSEVIIILTPLQICEAKLAAANATIAAQEQIIAAKNQEITALQKEIKSFVIVDTPVYKKI